MLLGHWYLNTPSMRLQPLQALDYVDGDCRDRALVAAGSLTSAVTGLMESAGRSTCWPFWPLRWLAGLLGILGFSGMTWQTLKIPNTQSATGILIRRSHFRVPG